MSEEGHAHPAPPHAGAPVTGPSEGETSERMFRRRLVKSLTTLNFRDLRAMQKEDLFEPHMHLFMMLVLAFAIGIVTLIAEPMMG